MNAQVKPLFANQNAHRSQTTEAVFRDFWKGLPHFDLEVARMAREFRSKSVVSLRGLIPEMLRLDIVGECQQALARSATRRDLTPEQTGDSPRHMSNVRRDDIAKYSPSIDAVYRAPAMLEMLSKVIGQGAHICPYEPEQYLITSLERKGDTQGWHIDDYGIALIWVVNAPESVEDGGFLQICHSSGRDLPLRISDVLLDNPIHTYRCMKDDVYLLQTDVSMHRVLPMRNDSAKRTILNMTWATDRDFTREHDHRSIEVLWA